MSKPVNVDLITQRMKDLDKTKAILAHEMGMSTEAIRILMIRRTAPLPTVHKLAKALQVDLEASTSIGAGAVSVAEEGQSAVLAPQPFSKPYQLPFSLPDFTGREDALETITRQIAKNSHRHCVIGLHGMGGIGKTTLAVAIAHAVKAKYPDGQLHIDVGGLDERPMSTRTVVEHLLTSLLGMRDGWPESEHELLSVFRSVLFGKRLLIILDNVHDERQIGPLLAGERSTFLLTSRNKLPIDHVHSHEVRLFDHDVAHRFLESLVCHRASSKQIAEIAKLCDYLPLALRVAGVFLRENLTWTAETYIDELERECFSVLSVGSDEKRNVEAVLKLSATQLVRENPTLALRWRQLAERSAELTPGSIAAAWDMRTSAQREIIDSLTMLVNRSLLLFDPLTNRYRFHDL
jgi:hypothetical protein